MPEVTMELVKQLREKTGVGMMDCKKALKEADGDIEKASDLLRKKGMAVAAKRSGNATENGIIEGIVDPEFRKASLVEISCETDFAARTQDMKDFAKNLSDAFMKSGQVHDKVDPFMAMAVGDTGMTAQSMLDEIISKISESIVVSKIEVSNDSELVNVYLHPDGTLGVLVELAADKAIPAESRPAIAALAKDICMQAAVTNPAGVDKDNIDAALVEREKGIASEMVKASGKPENMIEKIVEGKMRKFYEENCLVNQKFIKNDKVSVTEHMDAIGKEHGVKLSVKKMARFGIKR